MRKIGTVLVFLLFAAALHAAPLGPNLYVAGDGFTLEQAAADAQRDGATAYKILVTGAEAQRLVAARATRDTTDLLRLARASGARVFVCAKDVKALGVTPHDLIKGVTTVRGYVAEPKQLSDWERRVPRAPDRKSLAVCAE
jgi:intracellular sulfur oxidation DsrE/DsrF family protein